MDLDAGDGHLRPAVVVSFCRRLNIPQEEFGIPDYYEPAP